VSLTDLGEAGSRSGGLRETSVTLSRKIPRRKARRTPVGLTGAAVSENTMSAVTGDSVVSAARRRTDPADGYAGVWGAATDGVEGFRAGETRRGAVSSIEDDAR
jgi:hypothetical protein